MAFTYFFRDIQTLEIVRDYALPHLRTRRFINIWDAGCAMGAEPYTLAIMLRERMGHMYFRNVRIKATDIDESNLFGSLIAEAAYPLEQVKRIPEDILARYFVPSSRVGYYELNNEIKKSVSFQKHDLLSLEPIGKEFGLILCKNVLLHFHEEQRNDVIKMFHNSLMEGGFLVTEQTQKMPHRVEHLFKRVAPNAQLFRKL